ncbi:hypothetical protein DYB36_000118 [Aphanomyces astaci]|uniref:Uncharacterized protein n=2 Tax=Aphanomyces astaci TaxID=112090 RepID=A0A397AST7_APHAT|nr:hypothetical protein DYB36_000118 [Aphanomyces astaci]
MPPTHACYLSTLFVMTASGGRGKGWKPLEEKGTCGGMFQCLEITYAPDLLACVADIVPVDTSGWDDVALAFNFHRQKVDRRNVQAIKRRFKHLCSLTILTAGLTNRDHIVEAHRIQNDIGRKKESLRGDVTSQSHGLPAGDVASSTTTAPDEPLAPTPPAPPAPISSTVASAILRPKLLAALGKKIMTRPNMPPTRRQLTEALRTVHPELPTNQLGSEDGAATDGRQGDDAGTTAARPCTTSRASSARPPKRPRTALSSTYPPDEAPTSIMSMLWMLEQSREQWLQQMEERREMWDKERDDRRERLRQERELRERERDDYRDQMEARRDERAVKLDQLLTFTDGLASGNNNSPWLYQALPPRHATPMYLNSNALKSLFQADRPGYQSINNATRRRKRLQTVQAAMSTEKPPPSVNQADDDLPRVHHRRRLRRRRSATTVPSALGHRPTLDDAVLLSNNSGQPSNDAVASQLGLTADEFNALEASMGDHNNNKGDMEHKYRSVFDEFDVDHSGAISPDELRMLLKSVGEEDLDDADINDIIAQADADKNGQIEFNEFIQMMQARKRLLAVVQQMGKCGGTGSTSQPSSSMQSPLPPLKMGQVQQSKKHMKHYNVQFLPTFWSFLSNAMFDWLAELALSEYGLKELDLKVREDVQWVQANVPVTSLKAQLFCHKWGAEKMNALFSRILLNFQAKAFYKWIDYLKFLHTKLKADRYLKCKAGSRITTLMHTWTRKSLGRAWLAWSSGVREQRRNERHASAVEIQCLVRGFLSRTAVVRHLQHVGAVHFQRLVRGFLGRRRVLRTRRTNLELASASLLQRCFRGYAGRKLGRLLFQTQAEHRAASHIQRAFRAYEQKLFARAVAQTSRQHDAATTIQCAGRRRLAVRETNRRRLMRQKDASVRCIQRVGRGMLGRRRASNARQQRAAAIKIQSQFKGTKGRRRAKHVRDEKAVKRLMVRRDRAALKIQSAWRGKNGRYAYHLKLRAKKQLEMELTRLRHTSAVRIQALYRGYKGRLLCAHLDADRALRRRQEQQIRAALKIQVAWRGFHGRLAVHLRRQAKAAIDVEEKAAAVKIQSIARGNRARVEAHRLHQRRRRDEVLRREREAAATTIQAAMRGKMGRTKAAAKRKMYQTSAQEALSKLVKHAKEEAAIRIQCCIRGFLSRQRYRRRLREHKAKLARLELERQEANAVIRIQCALRKRKATKLLAQRRMEFQKRISMMASEKASDEIARLRREQEAELAAMKMQLLMEKDAIEKEASRLRLEVAARNDAAQNKLAEDQKQIAHEKLTAILEASRTDDALERLRLDERRARELDVERARVASAEARERQKAAEVARRQEEDAAMTLKHSLSTLDSMKTKDLVRKQELALAKEKDKTAAQSKALAEHHAAIKMQGWGRKQLARRRIARIRKDQHAALDALKNEEQRAVLKAKQDKEHARLKMQMLLDEEARAQEQEVRELQLMLKQKELREKQRVEQKKHKDLAARKIQAAGRRYVARRELKQMQRQMEFERQKREKAAKDAAAADVQDEWVEYWDENAQASYYFNIRTQEASWTKPGYTNPTEVAAQLLSYSTALTAHDFQQDNYGASYSPDKGDDVGYFDAGGHYHYYDTTNDTTPNDGWAQYKDEQSGAAYYYNHFTGERYWA